MSTTTKNGQGLTKAPDADRGEQNSTVKNYLRFARNYPILSVEEEQKLARRFRKGNKRAAELLVYHNMRFVLKVAMKFRGSRLSLDDIIQEGMIGAMEAAERFNPDFRVRFTTFSVWWIRKQILKSIAEKSNTVVIPVYMRQKISRLIREEERLCKELAEKPDSHEIKAKLEKLQEAILLLTRDLPTEKRITRLDAPIVGQDRTHAETIHDPNAVDPHDSVEKKRIIDFLHRLLSTLTPTQRFVVMCRFGFDSDRPLILREIAEKLGISRERVRQIETEALEKLQRELHRFRREENRRRVEIERKKKQAPVATPQAKPERPKLVITYRKHTTVHELEDFMEWLLDRP